MSVYEEFTLEQRAAAAGRDVESQRRYEAAYAETETRIRAEVRQPMPVRAPAPEVRQLAAPVPVHATGARAQWLRDTWGGRVSRLFAEPDEAGELQSAKAQADAHELAYGSRPPLAYFRLRARGAGTGAGTVLTGDTAELLGRIRQANPDQPIRMVVGPDPASAQIGGVVTAPGRPPEATGDAALAAGTLEQLARRQ